MSIGENITKLRKEKRLTQAALAKAANLSASAIAMYETGRRSPDEHSLMKLASALDVNQSILMGQQKEKTDQTKKGGTSLPIEETSEKAAGTVTEKQESPAARSSFSDGFTQLALSREEARIILFLRMNPQSMTFFQSYITAGNQRRLQLEKAWHLIHEFQH